MAVTYYMLRFSPILFFILFVIVCAAIAGITTWFFRRKSKLKILRSHNEVTGFFFIAIAGFYGLLMSFVVLVVWDQLNEVRGNVSKEGSYALSLYRDIKFYPDTTQSKDLLNQYLEYAYYVVDEEFPNMEKMKLSRAGPDALNSVFYKLEHLDPKNPLQVQLVAEMFQHLNELTVYRGLRIASMDSEISPPIWLPIILGALITLLCSILLDIEHGVIHIVLNSVLGAFIALFFFIIIILDHPFVGKYKLEPKSYKEIFIQEERNNNNFQKGTFNNYYENKNQIQ